jgi:hypothetical protein
MFEVKERVDIGADSRKMAWRIVKLRWSRASRPTIAAFKS